MTNCIIAGCGNSIPETVERYVCKNHPREVQVNAVRKYDKLVDHKDSDQHFQSCQFDERCDDKSDTFYQSEMLSGYQIVRARQHDEPVPDWAVDDNEIKRIISIAFPRFQSDEKQRYRAGQWVRFIYLYFKLRYTDGQIAESMNMSLAQVSNTRQRVIYIHNGLTMNGVPRKK